MSGDKITWYRLEKSKVILSTLSQTDNKYILSCKAARSSEGNGTVRLNGNKVQQESPTKTVKLSFRDVFLGSVSKQFMEASGAAHLVSSHGSPFISGGISEAEGKNLFQSQYFHGKAAANRLTNAQATGAESPPIFLRVRVPVDRLVRIAGGDTAAKAIGDVVCLGCKEKPGFIPVEWVDRIMWIVDKSKVTEDLKKTNSEWMDVRQFPNKLQLNQGESFGSNPQFLLDMLEKLSKIEWVSKLSKQKKENIFSLERMIDKAKSDLEI